MSKKPSPCLTEIIKHIKFPVRYDQQGQLIWDADGHMICDIRGWGWIQSMPNGQKCQDAIGESIAELINANWKP